LGLAGEWAAEKVLMRAVVAPAAKAAVDFATLTARLKPRPCKAKSKKPHPFKAKSKKPRPFKAKSKS